MNNFSKVLKRRLTLAGVYNAVVLVLLATGFMIGSRFSTQGIAISFASGFFIGLQIVMISYMRKYYAALKNEEKRKALYIEENDERNQFIESKIGGTGVNVVIGGISLGTLVACFIDQTAFFTLLSATLFCALVKGGLKMYYNKRI